MRTFDTGVAEGCVKLVATIIRYDKKLTELDASNNPMDRETCRVLLTALARNRRLKKLRICNIGINDELMKILKLGLIYNRGLRELYLDRNSISEAGLPEIKDIITENKKIEVISIEGNPIKSMRSLQSQKEGIAKQIKCELKIMTRQIYREHLKHVMQQ